MSSGIGAIGCISSLLVEWNYSVDVAINRVASVHGIECLSIIVPKPEVMDIFC
jgi:hypothetical protein